MNRNGDRSKKDDPAFKTMQSEKGFVGVTSVKKWSAAEKKAAETEMMKNLEREVKGPFGAAHVTFAAAKAIPQDILTKKLATLDQYYKLEKHHGRGMLVAFVTAVTSTDSNEREKAVKYITDVEKEQVPLQKSKWWKTANYEK